MAVQPLPSLLSIPVSLIDPHPRNVREDLGDIDELAASIIQVGLLQPLTVQKEGGRYRLLAGHRRLAAARYAGIRAVPCVLRRPKSDDESLVLMLVENLQRYSLAPLERARAMDRLAKAAGSQAEAARRIGLSQASVSQSVALLELTPEEQAQLERGDLRVVEAKRIVHTRRGSRTKYTGWHLGKAHPLAAQVRLMCNHSRDRKVGDVGCGSCWEEAIRADERRRLAEDPADRDHAYPSTPAQEGLSA